MKNHIGILFICGFLFGLVSCKKEEPAQVDFGYNYFPDQVGKYVIYQVDSFYYDTEVGIRDTFQFHLKERIDSVFMDNQNRPTLRIERYVKYRYYKRSKTAASLNPVIVYNPEPYELMPWVLKDIWSENKTNTMAEKVEENVRYIKLVFPLHENQRWNGNAQNTLDEWTYSYNFIDQPRTISNMYFDSVLEVNQLSSENIYERHYFVEQYARNTGMIYKEVFDMKSQPNPDWYNISDVDERDSVFKLFYNKPIIERIASHVGVNLGTIYKMSVVEHGTEP